MDVIRGVDGCKAGWLCLSARPGEVRPGVTVFAPDGLALLTQSAAVTAIDIPIGLPSSGNRRVDVAARSVLGRLKSSVFPVPVRAVLESASYEVACRESHKACGKKISRQTFGILPKIRDVDRLLREMPALLNVVHEVHPEVCFVHWNGGLPLQHPKTSGFGFVERLALVRKEFGSAPDAVRADVKRNQATDDDILDAFAALWTAKRIHEGRAVRVVDGDDRDAFGLPMQMWA
jgi:predicted RNase H-like nuclease